MNSIKLLLVFVLLFYSKSSFSQGKLSKDFKFRLGFSNTANNLSVWQFYDSGKHRRINSLYFGFSYSIPINEKTSIMLGTSLTNKGFKTSAIGKYPDYEYELSYRFDLNYLEIPLTFIYKTKYCDLNIGVNYSYLARACWNSYLYESFKNGKTTEYVYNSEITDLMKRNDWGIHLGFSKKVTPFLGVELILQENFIEPYRNTHEIAKQQTLFVGLQYYIY